MPNGVLCAGYRLRSRRLGCDDRVKGLMVCCVQVIDYVQEDLDAMHKELLVWSEENRVNATALQHEQRWVSRGERDCPWGGEGTVPGVGKGTVHGVGRGLSLGWGGDCPWGGEGTVPGVGMGLSLGWGRGLSPTNFSSRVKTR